MILCGQRGEGSSRVLQWLQEPSAERPRQHWAQSRVMATLYLLSSLAQASYSPPSLPLVGEDVSCMCNDVEDADEQKTRCH